MEKNDVITVTAEGLGSNCEGVARYGEYTVFVPFLLKGERARVKILKIKDRIAYGKAEEIFTPAEERVRPVCPVFGRCGGCKLQHVRYRDQLAIKTALVRDTLKKIGGISVPVSPCERSEKEYGYRNKLQLPIGRREGKNAVGFYAERSHRIVETDSCAIHPAWAGKVIAAVKDFMEKCGLDGYDEETGEGQLRHILVRELGGGTLVVLVAAVREIKGIDYLLFRLGTIFPEFSFYLNFNDKNTNVILGDEFLLLKGEGKYACEEGGITYEAGASTFLQVNEGVREKLYARAVSLVDEGETVIDCYAGGGLLTAMFAKKCGRAYGIEIVPEASACADALAKENGLTDRMENVCGRVEDELAGIMKKAPRATVVLDPPRAGVDRAILKEIAFRGVQKVIMISCNPATLARDLGILTGSLAENERGELVKTGKADGGYEIGLVQPFDMFPQTRHVETLVVLSHKKPDSHIEEKIDFDNSL